MYGFAPNSLEWKQYFGLASHGFASVTSFSLYCWTALVRAARKTIIVWRHSLELIKRYCEESCPVAIMWTGRTETGVF